MERPFPTYVLGGGGASCEGQPLGSSHAQLQIDDEAFDTVGHHLLLTLEELDIDRPLIKITMGFVEGARGQVVSWQGY